ncbi:MAG: hypothetical protein IPJ40_18335 [Saprospirales bacterium]|nr:hypothetical protein [Saprospirales bacterium]
MLAEQLGPDFQLVQAIDYTYYMPSGDERPYVYTVFQRVVFSTVLFSTD